MNAAVLIASRDLRDRSRLFLMAACMAVVPFAAALTVRENRPVAIATVTGFLAAAYTCSLALALGVSMVGRELTEKRLSFLFAKPVSAASIWIGKASAGMLTWLGAFSIVVLPTYLLAHAGWKDMWAAGGDAIAAYTLIMSTVLFFGSHAASTMLRSRSVLVAVDFALLAIMLIALFAMTRPILMGGGLDVVVKMLVAVAIAFLVILTVAPIWQIARGRIDPRRNHAALSTVLWSSVAMVLIVAGGYALWVISPPLSSIEAFNVEQSPSGQWISISGQASNRGSFSPSFLLDSARGESERVTTPLWGDVDFSNDGRTMVWMESDELLPRNGVLRLHTRLLEVGATQSATPLVMTMPRGTQLSEDGSRIAVAKENQLEVYALPSGNLLGVAAGIKGRDVRLMFFAETNVVRVVEISAGAVPMVRIREFDLARRKLATTAERPAPSSPAMNVTRDGSRLYVRHDATILDAHTGNLLLTLPVKPAKPYFGTMLQDGSAIVTRDSKLYHFDPSGALAAEVPIPVQHAIVIGQVGASKVLLSIGGENPNDWRMFVVDLAARKVSLVLKGVRKAPSWWDPVVPQFTEDATIAAMNGEHKLVLWDVRTGAKRPFPS